MSSDLSIIELAARRIDELRRSGVEVPLRSRPASADAGAGDAGGSSGHASAADAQPLRTPSHGARRIAEAAVPRAAQKSKAVHIDLVRLSALQYVDPSMPQSQIANEFRVIKRPLLLNVAGSNAAAERANLIMVTSSVPEEGKTFVSINLAISLAMEVDHRVLLVDADVARPSVLSRLALPQSEGLLDVLSKPDVGFDDVLLRTNIDKLSLLPAGSPQDRATELLASETMDRLLGELSSRYPDRIIVFDAPPLLPSTEARVLATHMGQVLLVVEAEQTSHKTLLQALATIESCPRVLPLLNKIARSEVGSYYGYHQQSRD